MLHNHTGAGHASVGVSYGMNSMSALSNQM
jgi:hypothetical protein